MWTVRETRKAEKQLDHLQDHLVEKYEFWKAVVTQSGVLGLISFPGFKDHALKGQWSGYRASYLNEKFRIIYGVANNAFVVEVVEVNAHDYRRKS